MIEAMTDIETLDTKNSAVVFQIGLVIFKENKTISKHQWNLQIDEQLKIGRTVSASTLAFHLGIPENLKSSIESGAGIYSFRESMKGFQAVVASHEIKNFWAKGSFDFNILESLLQDYNIGPPWKFFQLRELRTLMSECKVPKGDVSHNALEDCIAQIKQLHECRFLIGS